MKKLLENFRYKFRIIEEYFELDCRFISYVTTGLLKVRISIKIMYITCFTGYWKRRMSQENYLLFKDIIINLEV